VMKDVPDGKLFEVFAGHRILLRELLVGVSYHKVPPTSLRLECGSHAPAFSG